MSILMRSKDGPRACTERKLAAECAFPNRPDAVWGDLGRYAWGYQVSIPLLMMGGETEGEARDLCKRKRGGRWYGTHMTFLPSSVDPE